MIYQVAHLSNGDSYLNALKGTHLLLFQQTDSRCWQYIDSPAPFEAIGIHLQSYSEHNKAFDTRFANFTVLSLPSYLPNAWPYINLLPMI